MHAEGVPQQAIGRQEKPRITRINTNLSLHQPQITQITQIYFMIIRKCTTKWKNQTFKTALGNRLSDAEGVTAR